MDGRYSAPLVPSDLKQITVIPATKQPLMEEKQHLQGTNCQKEGVVKALLLRKPVMSFLDTLISVFIVAPCAIACWRGTWQLMDVYSVAFPPLPSCIFGGMLHLCFAIMREGLQVRQSFSVKHG